MNKLSTATRLIDLFLIHSLLKNCLTSVSVYQILYFVDSNKPVLGGVCFLQYVQLEFLQGKHHNLPVNEKKRLIGLCDRNKKTNKIAQFHFVNRLIP